MDLEKEGEGKGFLRQVWYLKSAEDTDFQEAEERDGEGNSTDQGTVPAIRSRF